MFKVKVEVRVEGRGKKSMSWSNVLHIAEFSGTERERKKERGHGDSSAMNIL